MRPALFVDGRCTTVSKHDWRLGRRVMGSVSGRKLFALLPPGLLFQRLAADERMAVCATSDVSRCARQAFVQRSFSSLHSVS